MLVEFDYAEITSDVACTATVEASADTIITLPARSYDGVVQIELEFFMPSWEMSSTTPVAFLTIFEGSSVLGRLWDARGYVASAPLAGFSLSRRFTPASGSRTYSIRGHTESGTFTVKCGAGGTGTLFPAFLRAVRI